MLHHTPSTYTNKYLSWARDLLRSPEMYNYATMHIRETVLAIPAVYKKISAQFWLLLCGIRFRVRLKVLLTRLTLGVLHAFDRHLYTAV